MFDPLDSMKFRVFLQTDMRFLKRRYRLKNCISSAIRQKGEFQNWCCKKTKHAKFSEKRAFLTSWYACTSAYQGIRIVLFSENLACFIFLKHPFWDLSFCPVTEDIHCHSFITVFLLQHEIVTRNGLKETFAVSLT